MINRRQVLTGVAAGVATAIAGPVLPTSEYVFAAVSSSVRGNDALFNMGRQMGKQSWAQLHMNEICRMRLDNIRTVIDAKD